MSGYPPSLSRQVCSIDYRQTCLLSQGLLGSARSRRFSQIADTGEGRGRCRLAIATLYRQGLTMSGTAVGTHMIVLPGGGYAEHAAHEAEPVARWLAEAGVQASVFRYPPHVRHPAP